MFYTKVYKIFIQIGGNELVNSTPKYALITGATGGLGRAFCKELCKKFENLFLTGTSQDRLEKLKDELLQANNNLNIICYACDLSSQNSISNLINFVDSEKIQIEFLVNNAGFITEGSFKNATISTILNCIKVNCEGTIYLTKEILDRKNPEDSLKIITVSSLAGNYPLPYMSIYSATKVMLKNFMLAIKEEYKNDNINLTVVQPGAIATNDDMKLAIKAQGIKGRLSSVEPEKIAKKAIKSCNKNKSIYIPGFFNKLTAFVSKLVPLKLQIKIAGKMWKKSQLKRGIK